LGAPAAAITRMEARATRTTVRAFWPRTVRGAGARSAMPAHAAMGNRSLLLLRSCALRPAACLPS
jgi:hypothetical protein